MFVSHRLRTGALVACLSFLTTGLAEAQLESQPVQTPTEQQPGRQLDMQTSQTGQASGEVEKYLANCLLAKNKAQIEISQLAGEEARDPQVKQFAQKMVREHRDLSQKLEKVAGTQMDTSGMQPEGAPGLRQPGQSTQLNPSGTNGGSQNDALGQLKQIDKQITQKATDAVKKELREKEDSQFDQAYLGCQIGAHMQLKAALEVIEQETSGELAQIAQQAKSNVEQHLQEAERLLKNGQHNSRQASRQPIDGLE